MANCAAPRDAVMVFSFLNCLAVLDDGALLLEFLEAANIWALLHPEGVCRTVCVCLCSK